MSRSRRLVAIMFTDIQGYTALMQRDEQKALQAREKHRRIFNSTTEKHRGNILQYYGDGTLSIFDSAIDAVNCAIEMQLGFREEPVIPVRIGIHTGDIVLSEEEIIGDSVNVASRVESLAVAGSVFISEKVYDELKNQQSIQTTRMKAFQLKNIETPVVVYAVSNPGLVVPDPEELQGKTEPAPTSTSPPAAKAGTAFLATKLFVPPPKPRAVQRPRLIERLEQGLAGKLSLVSAQAGFGKTTLVSEWIAGSDRPAGWLSLDESDGNLLRFLSYFVAALQKVEEHAGEGVLALLQSPQPPPAETILTALLNEIAAIAKPFLLVLDDYHLIDSAAVDSAVTFLLDHQPPQMHLVITTREDPNLPLARMRVRGELTELRAADLRFTPAEAAGFLNQAMGLELSEKNIAALETRTEGWIAGLQLAALSMKGLQDRSSFIQAFTGSHRFILDYLAEEVLLRQPEEVRSFLLQTSILDRLYGPLCDAVTGRQQSAALLEELERGNLFVVPLDDRRQWYRYHHLFADVLRARTAGDLPGQAAKLHRRASEWYEQNGSLPDAIRHALAAADFSRAADLTEAIWPQMDAEFQTDAWMKWLNALPTELVGRRPVLLLGAAWSALNQGDLPTGEAKLLELERLLGTAPGEAMDPEAPPPGVAFFDREQFRYLPASMATAQAYIAQSKNDLRAAVQYARQALDLLPAEDHLRRGPSAALLGLAQWAEGDLAAAYQAISVALDNFRLVDNETFALSGASFLMDILTAQGRLREAERLFERSLQMALGSGKPRPGTADLYLGLGELCWARGEQEAAFQNWQKAEELGESAALPDWQYRWCQAQARMSEAQGDAETAMELLLEAERLYYPTPIPNIRPIAAKIARLQIRSGRLPAARAWARERGLSADDELNYLQEFEHITLARLLLAEGDAEKASTLLRRLLAAIDGSARIGNTIETLVLLALAQETLGELPAALESLERALALAEPEHFVSAFFGEGRPMIRLLSLAAEREVAPRLATQLMALLNGPEEKEPHPPPSPPASLAPSSVSSLIDPLSERELEILALIAQGLSNQQIAKRLFVTLSTIKGHNQNIFAKLEVRRRTEAVARARELGLL